MSNDRWRKRDKGGRRGFLTTILYAVATVALWAGSEMGKWGFHKGLDHLWNTRTVPVPPPPPIQGQLNAILAPVTSLASGELKEITRSRITSESVLHA